MKQYTTSCKTTQEEQEVIINITRDISTGEWVAELDTNVQKYATKCKKAGWKQTSETRHTSGQWIAATFTAPARAVSIRSISTLNTRKIELTEEQKEVKRKALENHRQNKVIL